MYYAIAEVSPPSIGGRQVQYGHREAWFTMGTIRGCPLLSLLAASTCESGAFLGSVYPARL